MSRETCYMSHTDSGICAVSNTTAIIWYSVLGALIVTPLLIAGIKALWDMWYYR